MFTVKIVYNTWGEGHPTDFKQIPRYTQKTDIFSCDSVEISRLSDAAQVYLWSDGKMILNVAIPPFIDQNYKSDTPWPIMAIVENMAGKTTEIVKSETY